MTSPDEPLTAAIREAAYEMVAWSVVEVGPGSYQCRVCRADVTLLANRTHDEDCVADILAAALRIPPVSGDEPGIDVERLARAMWDGLSDAGELRIHADGWKELNDIARSIVTAYARLTREKPRG